MGSMERTIAETLVKNLIDQYVSSIPEPQSPLNEPPSPIPPVHNKVGQYTQASSTFVENVIDQALQIHLMKFVALHNIPVEQSLPSTPSTSTLTPLKPSKPKSEKSLHSPNEIPFQRSHKSSKSEKSCDVSSAVSLYEDCPFFTDSINVMEDVLDFPNVITQLSIYPISMEGITSPQELPHDPPHRSHHKKKLKPVGEPSPPGLFERTKQASQVYLPGSPSNVIKSPRPKKVLEPIVFKGGIFKAYHTTKNSTQQSPRHKKVKDQYGTMISSPLKIHSSDIIKNSNGNVSGFCRQCLLTGLMCKLVDCKKHNYFPKLEKK